MNRALAFTERNIKELLRDPLSYIFCLGFPILMLAVMSAVNASIPKEAGMTVFRIDNLSGGIAVFGQTFVMLFTALTVSQDRSGSFLVRMYASPMNSSDLVIGYSLPLLIIALGQALITYAASFIISLITGVSLSLPGMIASFFTLIPSALMFTALGIIFGTLFNEKAAPGICSLVISLGSFLGCIFFDADSTGGVLLTVCKCLPFYYCTRSARSAMALDFSSDAFIIPLVVVTASAVVFFAAASLAFRSKMRADLS